MKSNQASGKARAAAPQLEHEERQQAEQQMRALAELFLEVFETQAPEKRAFYVHPQLSTAVN